MPDDSFWNASNLWVSQLAWGTVKHYGRDPPARAHVSNACHRLIRFCEPLQTQQSTW